MMNEPVYYVYFENILGDKQYLENVDRELVEYSFVEAKTQCNIFNNPPPIFGEWKFTSIKV